MQGLRRRCLKDGRRAFLHHWLAAITVPMCHKPHGGRLRRLGLPKQNHVGMATGSRPYTSTTRHGMIGIRIRATSDPSGRGWPRVAYSTILVCLLARNSWQGGSSSEIQALPSQQRKSLSSFLIQGKKKCRKDNGAVLYVTFFFYTKTCCFTAKPEGLSGTGLQVRR
jgi:hypothetical protein